LTTKDTKNTKKEEKKRDATSRLVETLFLKKSP